MFYIKIFLKVVKILQMLNLLTYLNSHPEINLIDLYNCYPEETHSMIKNASSFNEILKSKQITGIPKSLVQKFPSSSDLHKFITVVGTIVKNGQVLLNNVKLTYTCVKCNSKCDIKEICDNCGGTDLIKSENFSSAMKCQKIRIQDISNPSCLSETLEVVLSDKHAGLFLPGERVLVSGIVNLKINNNKPEMDMKPTIYMEALDVQREEIENLNEVNESLYFEFNNLDPFNKRKFLIESFKNEIYGWNFVKLGLLLSIAKGSKTEHRPTIHILLVGDPSTGKSCFLEGCLKLVFPSVYANGIGTTDAGLTTCAVKQGKEWALEAGALVLSDMGLCCIDEIDAIKPQDCHGLLEAMEQQTLSIAKAGLVTTLNSRTSIIASAAAKYKYELLDDLISTNTLSTPLLTRFDLIFGMFEPKKDLMEIIDKVINRSTVLKDKNINIWNTSVLKSYLQKVRKEDKEIKMNEREILLNYYNKKRRAAGKASEFFSIRLLEGLMRLVEAHCKLVQKESIDEEDVYSVLILYEASLCTKKLIEVSDDVFINKEAYDKTKEELINKLK